MSETRFRNLGGLLCRGDACTLIFNHPKTINSVCDIGLHHQKKSSQSDALLNHESNYDKKQSNILNPADVNVENYKKCGNCGAEIPEKGRFCKKCDGRKRKRPHSDDEW